MVNKENEEDRLLSRGASNNQVPSRCTVDRFLGGVGLSVDTHASIDPKGTRKIYEIITSPARMWWSEEYAWDFMNDEPRETTWLISKYEDSSCFVAWNQFLIVTMDHGRRGRRKRRTDHLVNWELQHHHLGQAQVSAALWVSLSSRFYGSSQMHSFNCHRSLRIDNSDIFSCDKFVCKCRQLS